MNPKPFASLNHFTVPVVRILETPKRCSLSSEYRNAVLDRQTIFVKLPSRWGRPEAGHNDNRIRKGGPRDNAGPPSSSDQFVRYRNNGSARASHTQASRFGLAPQS